MIGLWSLPEGYSEAIAPAELKEDWPYSFAIRSQEWDSHGTRNHAVDFCARRSGSRWLAIAVPEGPAAGTVRTCRVLLDAADVGLPGMLAKANHRNDPQALALFEQVLAEFFERPSDKRNLP